MNTHTIVGVVCQEPEIRDGNNPYIKLRVQDKTKYNGNENPNNNFHCLKYGDKEYLEDMLGSLQVGTGVYLTGEGLYNKMGYYNIIISKIEVLNKIEVELTERYQSYYEEAFDSEHEDDRKE